MLSIITHRFPFFKKKEIWFYKGEEIKEEAYTSYPYVLGQFPLKYDHKLGEYTTTIDLAKSEEELYNAINKTFRYHISKGELFQYRSNFHPSVVECEKLIKDFNEFAAFKKITPANKKRILALQKAGKMVITSSCDNESEIVRHVYLFDSERIVLLHTFHDIENDHSDRGYANKCLHWKDILLFKKLGFKTYDFGGIDLQKVPGISNFKLSYGGEIEPVNSYIRIIGPLKLLFYFYKKIRN